MFRQTESLANPGCNTIRAERLPGESVSRWRGMQALIDEAKHATAHPELVFLSFAFDVKRDRAHWCPTAFK